ncbi:MAG: protein kinase [Oscillatoria sp. SIO1A7]|nr:protein kinase [Oscillatoria sp. SIO1A7]
MPHAQFYPEPVEGSQFPMMMISCQNPDCPNSGDTAQTDICPSCGLPLVLLKDRYRPIPPPFPESDRMVGMGSIAYLAEDIQDRDKARAIEQWVLPIADPIALENIQEDFFASAKELQKLGEHSQIRRVLDYFADNGSERPLPSSWGLHLYLVEEYIEGQTLNEELTQRGAFSEAQIRKLLQNLLPVLDFIHQQDLVHRDIKPKNILRDRENGNLIPINFSIAKHLSAKAMPQLGIAVGSLGYIPLEQLEGKEANPASDLYSLGCTCFELLGDIRPWELWKSRGYGWIEDWRNYLQQPVSEDFGRIMDWLLQENPQQRYQSAAEVLEHINSGWQRPLPVLPVIPPLPEPADAEPRADGAADRADGANIDPLLGQPESEINTAESANATAVAPAMVSSLLGESINEAELANAQADNNVDDNNVESALPATELPATELPAAENDRSENTENLETGVSPETRQQDSPETRQQDSQGAIASWESSQKSQFAPVETRAKGGLQKPLLIGGAVALLGLGIFAATKLAGNSPPAIADYQNATPTATLQDHISLVVSLAISPDGRTIASGSADETIKIWDAKSGELINTLPGHEKSVYSLAISPDGKTLVSGGGDKAIEIWDLRTNERKKTLEGHDFSVFTVAVSPDSKTIASGSSDKTIKIWELKTGELKNTLTGHSNWIRSLAFHPDSSTLVSGSQDKTVKTWDLKTGKEKKTLTGHTGGILSVAISPDGKIIASGSEDKTIKLWDGKTGNLKRTIKGYPSWFRSLTISPDGRVLMAGSGDKTIKMWDLTTGKEIQTLSGHDKGVYALAISRNGQTLVSGSEDMTVKVWQIP